MLVAVSVSRQRLVEALKGNPDADVGFTNYRQCIGDDACIAMQERYGLANKVPVEVGVPCPSVADALCSG